MRNAALFRLARGFFSVIGFTALGCGAGRTIAGPTPSPTPAPLWLPKNGDLRFQGLGAYNYSKIFLGTDIYGGNIRSFSTLVGSTLQLGSGVCGAPFVPAACYWFFSVNGPPTFKTTATFSATRWSTFETDIQSQLQDNMVITSLDIQIPYDVYATARVTDPIDQTYSGQHQHVLATDLQSTIQSLTKSGRIVTALAPDSPDGFQVFSYGWGRDVTSKYEAIVASSSIADVGTTFQTLAGQGYILTAFGGTRASGMKLVGTRLVGQTQSRPTLVSVNGSKHLPDPLTEGFVYVGSVFDDLLGNTNTQLLEQ